MVLSSCFSGQWTALRLSGPRCLMVHRPVLHSPSQEEMVPTEVLQNFEVPRMAGLSVLLPTFGPTE